MKGLFAAILSVGAVSAARPGWKYFDHDLCDSTIGANWGMESSWVDPISQGRAFWATSGADVLQDDASSDGAHCTARFLYTPSDAEANSDGITDYGTLQECVLDSNGDCDCDDSEPCVYAEYDSETPICSEREALYYMAVDTSSDGTPFTFDLTTSVWEDLDGGAGAFDEDSDGVMEWELLDALDLESIGHGDNVFRDAGCRRISTSDASTTGCENFYSLSNAGILTQCVEHKKHGWCHSGHSCSLKNGYDEICLMPSDDPGSFGDAGSYGDLTCEEIDEALCEEYSGISYDYDSNGERFNCLWKVKPPNNGNSNGNGNSNSAKCVPRWKCVHEADLAAPE